MMKDGCDMVPVNVLDVPTASLLWPAIAIHGHQLELGFDRTVSGGTQVAAIQPAKLLQSNLTREE